MTTHPTPTPLPLALCLEDLAAAPPAVRYLQCVALVGDDPGLTLDGHGVVRWRATEGTTLRLWVSADQRLCLERPLGTGPVTVRREGRVLEAPADRPVVLLDGDVLEAAGRRLRLHLHGSAAAPYQPPTPLAERAPTARVGRAAAAAMAVGAAVGAVGVAARADPPPPIEVRANPPKMAPPPRDGGVPPGTKKDTKKKPVKKPVK